MPELQPKVYICTVNWNGWRDTIECLEAVFRLNYQRWCAIVCDNGSQDGSLEKIEAWARGEIIADCDNPALRGHTSPPVAKPIAILRVARGETVSLRDKTERLVLVEAGANLGFAGATNIDLRLGLQSGDLDYAWLLNNDTVVDPDALTHLTATMEARPEVGMCGSTLLYYHDPQTIQSLGGSLYNRWTARGGHVFSGRSREERPDPAWVESTIRYVVGASMLVRREFLERVGLLDDSYFLYFDEIDWAVRGRHHFRLGYSPDSVVWHKEGAAIGTARLGRPRSQISEFYSTRSRLLFTGRHFPWCLPSVAAAVGLSALHRLVTLKPAACGAVLRGAFAGLRALRARPDAKAH